jgi:PP-loop superfamily ATP-utilizing enzyme
VTEIPRSASSTRDAISQLEALDNLLATHGLDEFRLRTGGPDAEIAVIEAPLTDAARLAGIAEKIRALGFRYVAIDLGSKLAQ